MRAARIALLALCVSCTSVPAAPPRLERPNVVWFFVDDMSANFSCYGEKTVRTPNVDRLAAEGLRFRKAFVTAPVCSPCRSALVTGMYQTSIGAHHHRSGRGVEKIRLPEGVELVPALFRRAGYWTAIGGPPGSGPARRGKTDYNFEWDPAVYDGADWSGRAAGQPFFMQFQTPGGKYREGKGWDERVKRELGAATRPEDVVLPPYYPRDPVLLLDWARYLDSVRLTDLEVGKVIARLEREGLLDSTVFFFMTDHGISHARGKQFLYDEGLHVPWVVRGPGIPRGAERGDLVEHIDLAATSLALAGIPLPPSMQGRDVLSPAYRPRDAVFAARDRCDETVERLRSVRTARHKYIRNFLPQRPHLQPNRYKDNKEIVRRLRRLHEEKALDPLQEALLFSPTRAPEELYDLEEDPFELKNLASDPAHRATLEALRARLDRWMEETGDRGRRPEPDAHYDSEMAEYLKGQGGPQGDVLRANIALMKRWAAEGK